MVYAYRRSYKSQIPSSGLTTNYSHDYLRQHCYSDRKEAESEFRKKTNGWWCVCSTWWPGKRLAECRSRFICSQGRRSANICWAENVLVLVRMNASPCERLKKKEKPFRTKTKKNPPRCISIGLYRVHKEVLLSKQARVWWWSLPQFINGSFGSGETTRFGWRMISLQRLLCQCRGDGWERGRPFKCWSSRRGKHPEVILCVF